MAGIPDPTPEQLEEAVLGAKADQDSVGGCIRCAVEGLPPAWGPRLRPQCGGRFLPAPLRRPRREGGGFGAGFGFASMQGAGQRPLLLGGGEVRTRTNHSGGVNGGITNGMSVEFEVAIRPTPPSPGSRTR